MNENDIKLNKAPDQPAPSSNNSDNGAERKPKRKLNIVPKVVCLFFAVLIWYYVMQVDNPDYKQTFTGVKVSLINTDELTNKGLSIFTGTSYTAEITVSGKKSVINNYSSDDIVIKADVMKNYSAPGVQTVDLDVTLPSGLTLVSQDNTISVFVDEKTSIKLPVTVDKRTNATTSADYESGTLVPAVSEVTVKGPKTIISNIDHAIVKADFSQFGILESTITTNGTVTLFNRGGEEVTNPYISLDYPTMSVTYPIYLSKKVPLTVSFKYGYYNDNNVNLEITPSEIEIKGDAAYVKRLESVELGVIDEKQMDKDKTLTYDLPLFDEFSYLNGVSSASVKISNVGTITKTYRVTDLRVNGGNKSCVILNDYVDVTLRGTSVQLAGVTSEDVSLAVDLSNYDDSLSGVFEFDAVVGVASSSKSIWEIGSYKLNISVNQSND